MVITSPLSALRRNRSSNFPKKLQNFLILETPLGHERIVFWSMVNECYRGIFCVGVSRVNKNFLVLIVTAVQIPLL